MSRDMCQNVITIHSNVYRELKQSMFSNFLVFVGSTIKNGIVHYFGKVRHGKVTKFQPLIHLLSRDMCQNVITVHSKCIPGIKTVRVFRFSGLSRVHNQDRNRSLFREGQIWQGDQISAIIHLIFRDMCQNVITIHNKCIPGIKIVSFPKCFGLCGVQNHNRN